ncbi:MAG: hypothetical protein ACYC67_17150 [Prosthecobacter sp.]|jgi:ElaB/YqjD/DUF883 family membrane-anchored ribosome-binding protein
MNNPTIPILDDPENLSVKAASVWERAAEKEVAAEARRAWTNTQEKASEALHTSQRYVHDHPGTSVLGGFVAGMLAGALLAWTAAHTQRNDTADSIHRFLARLGRKLDLE